MVVDDDDNDDSGIFSIVNDTKENNSLMDMLETATKAIRISTCAVDLKTTEKIK